jgi:hypothetical protein
MDTIPNIQELKVIALKKDLSVFECALEDDIPTINLILDKENPVSEFMELVQSLNRKQFFVHYFKPHGDTDEEIVESFGIDLDEITKDFYGDYYKDIYKKAEQFNNKLLKFPKDDSYSASLYLIDSGVVYQLELETEASLYFGNAEDYLDEICEKFWVNRKEIRAKKKEQSDKKREELYDKMIKELIDDGVFINCNTKASRKLFLINYFQKNKLEETFGDYSLGYLEAFADLLYADVKSKKNLKSPPPKGE